MLAGDSAVTYYRPMTARTQARPTHYVWIVPVLIATGQAAYRVNVTGHSTRQLDRAVLAEQSELGPEWRVDVERQISEAAR
jgi:hypothetical protein